MKTKKILFYLLLCPLAATGFFTLLSVFCRLFYLSLPGSVGEWYSLFYSVSFFAADVAFYLNIGVFSVLILCEKRWPRMILPTVLFLTVPAANILCQYFIRLLILVPNGIMDMSSEQFISADLESTLIYLMESGIVLFIVAALKIHAVWTKAEPIPSLVPKTHLSLVSTVYFAAMIVLTVFNTVTSGWSAETAGSLVGGTLAYVAGYFLSYLGTRLAYVSETPKESSVQ